jgi:hypothetical protein
MSTEQLSEREQRVLEHLRRAQELKVGLAEYARQAGVDAGEIYSGKQSLVRKGVIAARVRRGDSEGDEEVPTGKFVPIQMVGGFRSSGTPVCQIRHPSGVVIECSSFPPVTWITAVLSGGSDVLA